MNRGRCEPESLPHRRRLVGTFELIEKLGVVFGEGFRGGMLRSERG